MIFFLLSRTPSPRRYHHHHPPRHQHQQWQHQHHRPHQHHAPYGHHHRGGARRSFDGPPKPNFKYNPEELHAKIEEGVKSKVVFNDRECRRIEDLIDEICRKGQAGHYKSCTLDKAPLRNKYFFGEGYIYGNQLKVRGYGNEKLYPQGECDPIPSWIFDLVVDPIVEAGLLPEGFVNSVVINDYQKGGCIVSHIDPPKLFTRYGTLRFTFTQCF